MDLIYRLKVLIVTNTDVTEDWASQATQWADYIKRKFPLLQNVLIDTAKVTLPLKFKDFGVYINRGDFAGQNPQTMWGLDGIKEQIRQTGLVSQGQYNLIIFNYQVPDSMAARVANWTYPNDLNGAVFIEKSCRPEWATDWYRVITHEGIHAFHRLLWNQNTWTIDDLDLYDHEFDIEFAGGNRERNIARLIPYQVEIVSGKAAQISYWQALLASIIEKLKALTNSMPQKTKLMLWADAIKQHEGWASGSRSFRNHNPGNLKTSDADPVRPGIQPTAYLTSLGAIGADFGGFVIFADDATGIGYTPDLKLNGKGLCQFLKDCASRQIIPFHRFNPLNPYHRLLLPAGKAGDELPDLSLIDFFNIYAPVSDNNDANAYALAVAKQIGVDPQTKVKTLLS